MAETATKSVHQLQVRKTIPATAEEVFDAWTNPKSLEKWMRPGPSTGARAQLDARIDGNYRIEMLFGEQSYVHTGTYRRVERPRVLEFTWVSPGTEQKESVVTVELTSRGKQTDLVLTHRLLPSDDARAKHEGGWGEILNKLAQVW